MENFARKLARSMSMGLPENPIARLDGIPEPEGLRGSEVCTFQPGVLKTPRWGWRRDARFLGQNLFGDNSITIRWSESCQVYWHDGSAVTMGKAGTLASRLDWDRIAKGLATLTVGGVPLVDKIKAQTVSPGPVTLSARAENRRTRAQHKAAKARMVRYILANAKVLRKNDPSLSLEDSLSKAEETMGRQIHDLDGHGFASDSLEYRIQDNRKSGRRHFETRSYSAGTREVHFTVYPRGTDVTDLPDQVPADLPPQLPRYSHGWVDSGPKVLGLPPAHPWPEGKPLDPEYAAWWRGILSDDTKRAEWRRSLAGKYRSE